MNTKEILKRRAAIALALYMLCLFWIVILKCNLRQGVIESRYFLGQMSLFERTFFSLGRFATTNAKEALLNMLIFIPVGALIPFIARKNSYMTSAMAGIAISLSAEICQLILPIGGFTYVDIINNSLGAFLGAALHFYLEPLIKDKRLISAISFASTLAVGTLIFATFNTIKNIEIYIMPAEHLL